MKRESYEKEMLNHTSNEGKWNLKPQWDITSQPPERWKISKSGNTGYWKRSGAIGTSNSCCRDENWYNQTREQFGNRRFEHEYTPKLNFLNLKTNVILGQIILCWGWGERKAILYMVGNLAAPWLAPLNDSSILPMVTTKSISILPSPGSKIFPTLPRIHPQVGNLECFWLILAYVQEKHVQKVCRAREFLTTKFWKQSKVHQ